MKPLFFFFSCAVLAACGSRINPQHLEGAWKVDSTYTYYNGFDFTQVKPGKDWATYVYDRQGVMKEIKHGSFLSYFYTLHAPDSLVLRSTQGSDEVSFRILELNTNRLVLKKSKPPVFEGGNQTRYEIRFFSRTEIPQDETIPFGDPRQ